MVGSLTVILLWFEKRTPFVCFRTRVWHTNIMQNCNKSLVPERRPQDRCYQKFSNLPIKPPENSAEFVHNTGTKGTKTRALL